MFTTVRAPVTFEVPRTRPPARALVRLSDAVLAATVPIWLPALLSVAAAAVPPSVRFATEILPPAPCVIAAPLLEITSVPFAAPIAALIVILAPAPVTVVVCRVSELLFAQVTAFATVMVPLVVAITFALASAFCRSVVLRTELAALFVGLNVLGSPPEDVSLLVAPVEIVRLLGSSSSVPFGPMLALRFTRPEKSNTPLLDTSA